MSVYKAEKGTWRYQVYYKTPQGLRKKRQGPRFKTKREALKAEAEFIAKVSPSPTTVTFGQVADEYFEDSKIKETKTEATIREYQGILHNHFGEWEDLKIGNITPNMIQKKFTSLAAYGSETKNKFRNLLNSIFKFAEKFYDLEKNPVSKIDPFPKTSEEKKRKKDKDGKVLHPEDFKKFISCIPADKEDYKFIFYFLYFLGLRRDECLGIKFSAISRDGILHIYQQSKNGHLVKRVKNESSDRYIQLPPHLMAIVEHQMTKYKGEHGYTKDWYLFGGYRPCNASTLDRCRKKAIEASGVHEFINHDLRHTFITMSLENTENPYTVSKIAGHSNTKTTMEVYGHSLKVPETWSQNGALAEEFFGDFLDPTTL